MKYCDGIDCSWCSVPEPCIYREANRLSEENEFLKRENEFLKEQIKTLKSSIRIVQDETKTDN